MLPEQKNLPESFSIDCDIYQICQTADTLRIRRLERPCRPSNAGAKTAEDYRHYATKLEQYENQMIEYKDAAAAIDDHNTKIDRLIEKYICETSGLNSIPQQYRAKVWSLAYEEAHHGGYIEIYNYLCRLVDIFDIID